MKFKLWTSELVVYTATAAFVVGFWVYPLTHPPFPRILVTRAIESCWIELPPGTFEMQAPIVVGSGAKARRAGDGR